MTDLRLRPARADDATLLAQLLADSLAWRTGAPVGPADVVAHPRLARWVEGWPLQDDAGVVGEADGPVGAAWYRRIVAHDEGFVSESIPVLTVAVRPDQRRRGHGTTLLNALTERACEAGVSALSLAVAADHPAVPAYRRLGFVQVGAHEGGITMLRELS